MEDQIEILKVTVFTTKIFIQVFKFTLLAYINNYDKKSCACVDKLHIACFT
jgi:hypothetical protein